MLAIYTRLSREDELSNSIKNQIREGKLFAKSNGFKDIEIYNEGEGISGASEIKDRPQLFRLLQDIRNELIDVVWFRNQNRLERNTSTYAIFTAEAQKFNVRVFFNNTELDFSDPSNKLFGNIKSAINQYQKDLQSFQTKKTLLDNVAEGKAHGIIPYGYTRDENKFLIIDDIESIVVKRIYDLSLKGFGTNKIAEILNQENTPTRYSSKYKGSYIVIDKFSGSKKVRDKSKVTWKGGTVRNIITNTIYKGKRKFQDNYFDVDAIVTPSYWQKVNDNLKNNRNNSGQTVKHNYLLRGKLICGKCGENYYGRTRVNKKDNYYMCSSKRLKDKNCGNRSINIDVLEYFIWQLFFVEGELKNIIKKNLENNDEESKIKELSDHLCDLNNKMANIQKEHRNAVTLAVKGLLTEKDLLIETARIKNESDALEIKRENLEAELKSYQDYAENIMSDVERLKHVKENATFNEKKKYIEDYIKQIVITEKVKGELFVINIEFNIIDADIEEYYIPIPKYLYAIEKCNGILIPLSKTNRNLSESDKWHISYEIYRRAGRTHVEYRIKEDDLLIQGDDHNCNYETCYIWLNTDDWENEFKDFCTRQNINAEAVSWSTPHSDDEFTVLNKLLK